MYYTPKYFHPKEIFSKKVVNQHSIGDNNIFNSIWRLMDSKTLWTLDRLREQFGETIVNDYKWDGIYQQRGYRDFLELLDITYFQLTGKFRTTFSSFTSQHCFGRAIDSNFKNESVQDVRRYIIKNKKKDIFKYITAIEKDVSWFHFDTRNFKKEENGFLIF